MSNLTDLMTRAAAGIDATPTAEVLDDDLARGHRARRLRSRRAAGAGVTAVLAVGLALAVPLTSTPPAAAVPLVAFVGEQPDGFVLDVVPEGWRVLASTPGDLVLAAEGDSGEDPAVYTGRIVATLLAPGSVPDDLGTAPTVTVDGEVVSVYPMLGADGPDGTHGVFVAQGDGRYLYVQVPAEVHWTAQAAAEFAATVTATGDATASVG
ncbi:hypothetical protein [Cellulomonas phragmiteti]|uniref:Alanine and proline-rich secreted protein Apa n=1 Tax=Cellulomonas phragmiteti TaxID=478780 RepID=A0ABQ4DQX8_9CELL|nr:hypothetical protein [Cellulomonas phragmiteti]GIG41761.1 hypothetical protein Cph01nite_35230 [Cellulomonas phragmiteti]